MRCRVSAAFAVLWFVTFNMQDVFREVPPWTDLGAYAEAFHISRLTLIYPSLLLAVSYLVLLASLHRALPENKKIWSLIALAIGILYATMASVNYNIQAVAVRMSLAAAIGQTGYSMFDWPEALFIGTSMVWVIGSPLAFVLMALWFRAAPETVGARAARMGKGKPEQDALATVAD